MNVISVTFNCDVDISLLRQFKEIVKFAKKVGKHCFVVNLTTHFIPENFITYVKQENRYLKDYKGGIKLVSQHGSIRRQMRYHDPVISVQVFDHEQQALDQFALEAR